MQSNKYVSTINVFKVELASSPEYIFLTTISTSYLSCDNDTNSVLLKFITDFCFLVRHWYSMPQDIYIIKIS